MACLRTIQKINNNKIWRKKKKVRFENVGLIFNLSTNLEKEIEREFNMIHAGNEI